MNGMEGQLKLVVYGADGRRFQRERLLSVGLAASVDAVADGLTVRLAGGEELPELSEWELWLGEQLLSSGLVDEQEHSWDSHGHRVELAGRSWGALLLDNEALPAVYEDLTLRELARRSLEPYGRFSLAVPQTLRLPQFTIPKGLSEWEALERFCQSALGVPLWLDGDTVRAGTRPTGRRWSLLPEEGGALPVKGLYHRVRRVKLISKVCLRDTFGYYSSAVGPPAEQVRGVRRKRYLIPPSPYTGKTGQDADQLLRRALAQRDEVTAELAGLWPVRLCDVLRFPPGLVGWTEGAVVRVEHRLDGGGGRTTVTLVEPDCLRDWSE